MGRKLDTDTTLSEIKHWIIEFDSKRDWDKYHHPKELAISISLEAAELLENFQWKENQSLDSIKSDNKIMKSLKDELADIIIYSFNFANQLDIDVSEAIKEKLEENDTKYPIEKARGLNKKYTEL